MLKKRAEIIKLVIFDVDGVMTDGRMIYDESGRELKSFDVQDGLGIHLLHLAGIATAIISGRKSKVVTQRAKELNIKHVFQGCPKKIGPYHRLLKKLNLKDVQACFIGDDVLDISVLRCVGLPIAVANAAIDVKKEAFFVCEKEGGRGAIREAAQVILKAQEKWDSLLSKHYAV